MGTKAVQRFTHLFLHFSFATGEMDDGAGCGQEGKCASFVTSMKHRLPILNQDLSISGPRIGFFQLWHPELEWRTRAGIFHFVLDDVSHGLLLALVFWSWSEVRVEAVFYPEWGHSEVPTSIQLSHQWGLFLQSMKVSVKLRNWEMELKSIICTVSLTVQDHPLQYNFSIR